VTDGKDFKGRSAEIIADLLSDERVRRGLKYFQGEEFRSERDRVRRRTPEAAAREKELTLRLAEVEAEAAELRIRLSELLEEEERLRTELRDL
jgi:predicted nuclease with TOPRIM domain